MIKFKGTYYCSYVEVNFAKLLEENGIEFINEYKFDNTTEKGYRFDFAIIDKKIAIEIEGIGPPGKESRHQRFQGYMEDCEKYNLAVMQGWKIYRIPSPWLTSKRYSNKVIKFLKEFKKEFKDEN